MGTGASHCRGPLVSYRKAITTLRAAGYNPDTLVLTPAADEALDVMVSGITGGTADFVFAPGQFSATSFFGLIRRSPRRSLHRWSRTRSRSGPSTAGRGGRGR